MSGFCTFSMGSVPVTASVPFLSIIPTHIPTFTYRWGFGPTKAEILKSLWYCIILFLSYKKIKSSHLNVLRVLQNQCEHDDLMLLFGHSVLFYFLWKNELAYGKMVEIESRV